MALRRHAASRRLSPGARRLLCLICALGASALPAATLQTTVPPIPGGDPREQLEALQAKFDKASHDLANAPLDTPNMDTAWGDGAGLTFASEEPSPFRS